MPFCTKIFVLSENKHLPNYSNASMDTSDNCPVVPVRQRKLCTLDRMPFYNQLISIKIEQIPNLQEEHVLSEMWLKRMDAMESACANVLISQSSAITAMIQNLVLG